MACRYLLSFICLRSSALWFLLYSRMMLCDLLARSTAAAIQRTAQRSRAGPRYVSRTRLYEFANSRKNTHVLPLRKSMTNTALARTSPHLDRGTREPGPTRPSNLMDGQRELHTATPIRATCALVATGIATRALTRDTHESTHTRRWRMGVVSSQIVHHTSPDSATHHKIALVLRPASRVKRAQVSVKSVSADRPGSQHATSLRPSRASSSKSVTPLAPRSATQWGTRWADRWDSLCVNGLLHRGHRGRVRGRLRV